MRFRSIIIAPFFALALVGCDSGAQTGQIQLALVGSDQIALFNLPSQPSTPASNNVASAFVTVKEVDARVGGSWVTVTNVPQTIDLLALDNKGLNSLGIVTLPVGHIDGLRLVLDEMGDYVVLADGSKKPLEVPDNGIVKVVGSLDLDACAAGIVILDFDPKIKVEDEGGRKEYELRSTARIKTEEIKNACGGGGGGGTGGGGGGGGGGGVGPDMAGTCGGILCPPGHICQGGVCVADPCAGIVCPPMKVCQAGVCVPSTGGPDMALGPDMAHSCHH